MKNINGIGLVEIIIVIAIIAMMAAIAIPSFYHAKNLRQKELQLIEAKRITAYCGIY